MPIEAQNRRTITHFIAACGRVYTLFKTEYPPPSPHTHTSHRETALTAPDTSESQSDGPTSSQVSHQVKSFFIALTVFLTASLVKSRQVSCLTRDPQPARAELTLRVIGGGGEGSSPLEGGSWEGTGRFVGVI